MIIIVCGTDKSGKSTLCRHLSEKFNLTLTHCSKPQTDNPYNEYMEMIEKTENNSIYDRFFLGEYVYANLWRGGCKISLSEFNDLEYNLLSKGITVLLIYAFAPKEVIAERFITEKEELSKIEEIEKAQKLFSEIIENSKIPTLWYNSSISNPEEMSERVSSFLEHI